MKKILVYSKEDMVRMLRECKKENRLTHKKIDELCGAPKGTSSRMHHGGSVNKHILKGLGFKKEIVYVIDSELDGDQDD